MEIDPFAQVQEAMTEEEEEDDSKDSFKLALSVLVALAAISVALVAWASGVVSNQGGHEDGAAISAGVNAQHADLTSRLQSLGDYTSFTAYRRHLASGDSLALYVNGFLGSIDPGAATLRRQAIQSWDVAWGISGLFSPRWSHRDINPGTAATLSYDMDREYESARAEAALRSDVNPETHLEEGGSLHSKSTKLVGAIVIIAVAIWLFTLSYGAHRAVRVYPAAAALAIYGAGSVYATYVYFVL